MMVSENSLFLTHYDTSAPSFSLSLASWPGKDETTFSHFSLNNCCFFFVLLLR